MSQHIFRVFLSSTFGDFQAERERLQKRVEKLDQTIGELATKLDDVAEKEFAALKRSAQSSKPTPNMGRHSAICLRSDSSEILQADAS